MLALGSNVYFASGWNVFDFFVTILGVMGALFMRLDPSLVALAVLRPLRWDFFTNCELENICNCTDFQTDAFIQTEEKISRCFWNIGIAFASYVFSRPSHVSFVLFLCNNWNGIICWLWYEKLLCVSKNKIFYVFIYTVIPWHTSRQNSDPLLRHTSKIRETSFERIRVFSKMLMAKEKYENFRQL